MTRRLRTLLVDNSIGKIYNNIDSSLSADASNLIAGTKISSIGWASAGANIPVRITKNLGSTGSGITFNNNTIIRSVVLTCSITPGYANIIVALKVGSTYSTSSQVATANLTVGVLTQTTNTAITLTPGQAVFADITQIGSNIHPGYGLSITLNYFSG